MLGLALVAALVVGGSAEQPPNFGTSGDQFGVPVEPFGRSIDSIGQTAPPDLRDALPPGQVSSASELAKMRSGSPEMVPQVGSAGELIGFNGFDGSGSQTITLVHTGKMQIAVYHIDRSGQIHLVSSRPIDADFSLSLNVTAPLPGQIRLLGGQVK
ncbi:MAG: hypothetical protein KDB00_21095 [Planctomycetales bacterium]|nr:hypothetical protein [Planctomycetales bacterium]